jgi:predicted RNase H-like HicB family nuclease
MNTKTYRVVVSREGDIWLADVPDLPGTHTYAKTLGSLDANVREVIALVEDLPDGAEAELRLDYDVHTGDADLDAATARLRAERERLRAAERELTLKTEALARQMRGRWSVRDCASLLGVSMQRISQIAPQRATTGGAKSTSVSFGAAKNVRATGRKLRSGRAASAGKSAAASALSQAAQKKQAKSA